MFANCLLGCFSGATIQILLFGIIAIELKRKAPNAHTVTEIVLARWGYTAHKVFLFFALTTNVIVTSMLLLGGAAVVNALTGMNLNAASFLIPIGVIIYTMAGGLKATFMASYIHTAVIMLILLSFVIVVYITDDDLGSPKKVYYNLEDVASLFPVPDNEEGSYVTMLSGGGLMFGIINIVGNFGTVFMDQSYWQSAIAARPSAATKGYLLGGFAWFTIPFALATALGLSCVALDLPVTVAEAGSGLVPPAAAVHFWGSSGAYAILIMLFMAVTSTGSAELIAVSSLFVYDVYKVYINPKATGKDIVKWSRIIIFCFGLFMGCFSLILNAIGLNLGWVYLFMGVVIGSAVIPISYLLLWKKCSANAAMAGAIIGQIAAICSWLGAAKAYSGEVTVETLGANEPMLIGNLVAILGSGLICTTMSLLNPDDFDFEATRNISLVSDDGEDYNVHLASPESEEMLAKAKKNVVKYGVGFTLLIVVLWPVLSIPAGVFTEGYFSFWVIIAIIWAFAATIIIIVLPIFESRGELGAAAKGCLSCTPAERTDAKAFVKPEASPSSDSEASSEGTGDNTVTGI